MRSGLLALVLATAAGCPAPGDDGGYSYYPPGGGPQGGCKSDDDCASGLACARDGSCLDSSQIHHISTAWTVHGQPASDATCASQPNLEIQFSDGFSDGFGIGYAPVPCNEGRFTVDKMPTYYTTVGLGAANSASLMTLELDRDGNVSFDLN